MLNLSRVTLLNFLLHTCEFSRRPTYLSYIQPGKDLIGEFINTLRGLVEIEQGKSDRKLQQTLQDNEKEEKKRDRNLQITIAVLGVGIGVAALFPAATP